MLLNNPALIQCHYTVITMEIVFCNTELQYYCVIAVNYHDKKHYEPVMYRLRNKLACLLAQASLLVQARRC